MSDNVPNNPLLNLTFRIPFDQIRAQHVQPAVTELLRDARQRLDRLAAGPQPRTFDNTLMELDALTEPLDEAMAVVRHLESVATYPELREVFNAAQPEVSAFYSGIPLHAGLWQAIRSYSSTDEARALAGTRRRFLTKTLDTFRRHGADLDPAGKARLEAIDIELATITTKFSQNVLDSTNAFELAIADEAGLAGLPPSAVAAARASAAQKDLLGWRFTLQAPSYTPVMMY
jgi:oligopeptidase A